MSRYDLLTARKSKDGEKAYFTKIGVAFANRSGDGYSLTFEALPLPDAEGQTRVLMIPPKEREERPANGSKPRPTRNDPSDDIPF